MTFSNSEEMVVEGWMLETHILDTKLTINLTREEWEAIRNENLCEYCSKLSVWEEEGVIVDPLIKEQCPNC